MIRAFDKRYRGDHPMFQQYETCDECNKPVKDGGLFEYGKDYICRTCWEKHLDEAEYYLGPE